MIQHSPTMDDLRKNALLATKNQLIFQLDRFATVVNSDAPNVQIIEARFEDSKGFLSQFIRVGFELQLLDSSLQTTSDLEEFESKYYDTITKAKSVMKRNLTEATTSESSSSAQILFPPNIGNSLKRVDLPEFSGGYMQWQTFKQMFTSLVHNTKIPTILKFTHLKKSITGKAAALINQINFSEENYEVALKALSDRYDNRKFLQYQQVKNLLNMDDIFPNGKPRKLNSSHLESMYNRITQTLHSLKASNVLTCCWDPILAYVVISKFDEDTLADWEKVSQPIDPPTQTELLDFLKRRQRVIESVEEKKCHESNEGQRSSTLANQRHTSFNSRKRNAPSFAFWEQESASKVAKTTSKNSKKCDYCNENHKIWSCLKFKKLSLPDKITVVKTEKLCILCLRDHSGECTSNFKCRLCNEKHSSLLHGYKEATKTKPNSSSQSSSSNI